MLTPSPPAAPAYPPNFVPAKATIFYYFNLLPKTGQFVPQLTLGNGLCNGTRFVLTRIHDHMLEGVIITGDFITQRVLVPRITLQLSDSRFPFTLRRRQFPVRVAFA